MTIESCRNIRIKPCRFLPKQFRPLQGVSLMHAAQPLNKYVCRTSDSTTCDTRAPRCCWFRAVSPRVVIEILGHSQISLTMNTYSRVVPQLQCEAARSMDALLDGPS